MKYIIVTDTHLGYKNGSDEYHNITISLFNKIVEVAIERNIKKFIHGGDFFDSRKSIPVKSIPIAYQIIDILRSQFNGMYFLAGNHDIHYRNSIDPTSLDIFKNIPNLEIIKKATIIGDNIHLQPWLIDEFKPMFDPIDDTYLIGHFEMSGIVINRAGTESKSGIPVSLFKKYKKVLSGHYHTRSSIGNVTYLGSPFHMTFNDADERGFYIFDSETGELEFIPFTNYPKFVIFEYDKIKMDEVKGNNVKIVFTKDIGTTKINAINNTVSDLGPNQLFVEFSFGVAFDNEKVNDREIESIIDVRAIEKAYLDSTDIPVYINRGLINREMDMLWKKMEE